MNLIIDASNIIHRSFWMANKRAGDETNNGSLHAYIFLRSLKSYCDKFKPTEVYCVWDKKLEPKVPNFRKVIAAETYKTNRDSEATAKVYNDFDIIEQFVNALGCYNVYPFAMEGDDVIAYLTRKVSDSKLIISSDRDLLQLINASTSYYDVNKKVVVNPSNFESVYEIPFAEFVQHKCLVGDPADNIARILTPAKAKKVVRGELQLTTEQQEQYELNFKLTDLHNSYDHQPGELEKMDEQFKFLSHNGSFKLFTTMCRQHQMQDILSKEESWQQTFFGRKSLHNIVNLLKLA